MTRARRWVLPSALAAALVAAAFWLRARDRLPDTPQDAVKALFDAAARGDSAAYLRLLSGPLRDSLEDTRRQLGPDRFAESLRQSLAGLKGLGMTGGAAAPDGQAVVEAELVFADRNERQRISLNSQGRGWTITAIGRAAYEKPVVPYGTPVYEEPPRTQPPRPNP
jgi:hypothetical protein